MSGRPLRLFSTPPHECSYQPDQTATNAVIDPDIPLSLELYSQLINHGFRRSGSHLFAPHCSSCNACESTRVSTTHFKPNRSQRRCWRNNQDLDIHIVPGRYTDEYFELYQRYLDHRHPDGGMNDTSAEKFVDFFLSAWSKTLFIEFRDAGRLVSIAVVDELRQGFSAVYTFFDPEEQQRGLGTLVPLWLIEHAREQQKPWVYLGFWIEQCEKMRYKTNFKPVQLLRNGVWQDL